MLTILLRSDIEYNDFPANPSSDPWDAPSRQPVKGPDMERVRCDAQHGGHRVDVIRVVEVDHCAFRGGAACDGEIFRVRWAPSAHI